MYPDFQLTLSVFAKWIEKSNNKLQRINPEIRWEWFFDDLDEPPNTYPHVVSVTGKMSSELRGVILSKESAHFFENMSAHSFFSQLKNFFTFVIPNLKFYKGMTMLF